MSGLASLPSLLYEPLIRRALEEDLGRAGDLTSDAKVDLYAGTTDRANLGQDLGRQGTIAPSGADRVAIPRIQRDVGVTRELAADLV